MISTCPKTLRQRIEQLQDTRLRTLELINDLNDDQMVGPRLAIVNPLRWEIGHVAWFQEYWLLRHSFGSAPIRSDGDVFYDSAHVAHDTRWDLPLPSKADTMAYMQRVLDQVFQQYNEERTNYLDWTNARIRDAEYFLSLALFHEDMHAEAITYTRQTLAYPSPRLRIAANDGVGRREPAEDALAIHERDAPVPGGKFLLGSTQSDGFVFDNELQAHEVEVKPFAISRTATTQAEYAEFVNDGGYRKQELWSVDGWQWREKAGADHPVYWKFAGGEWWRRIFDQMVRLEKNLPVLHVNWYEADAYCRWVGRRLPTEVEWEMAASGEMVKNRGAADCKRSFPWGDEPPTPVRANLDSQGMGCIDVRALPAGDSAFGCRQMIGNVWEWTASDFTPYPGFVAGPYKEYSAPWFGNHKVLRGGCWATRSRLIHNSYRNFYTADRRDVWAGFRTCAL